MLTIGVDFDNTIVCYDEAFPAVAKQEKLLPPSFGDASKTAVRDAVRKLDNGEHEWQRLQGLVYGRLIMQAKLFDGVEAFFAEATRRGHEIYIISHKTELAHHDPLKTNLRDAARGFLREHGFFTRLGLPEGNVLFAATREEKIRLIGQKACGLFIDDLPEVLLDPAFPAQCEKLHFSIAAHQGLAHFPSWEAIRRFMETC